MKTHLTVITGASRGLGRALAELRLAQGHRVLSLSRQRPPWPAPAPGTLEAFAVDLADPQPVARKLHDWLAAQDPQTLASATLINNAARMSALVPLQGADFHDLSLATRVGLEAPLLLSAAFLRATARWTLPRKLLMVSSGLGRRGMAGAASYCAIKAGLDNLARAIALEEEAQPHGARVSSLAPGVIDTDMQAQLRGADPEQFASQRRFAAMKADNQLPSATQVAVQILQRLDRADFGEQPVSDVRERG